MTISKARNLDTSGDKHAYETKDYRVNASIYVDYSIPRIGRNSGN